MLFTAGFPNKRCIKFLTVLPSRQYGVENRAKAYCAIKMTLSLTDLCEVIYYTSYRILILL